MLVEDNGPIHTSKLSRAALAARADWLAVEWLPRYSPELTIIEIVWRDLKAHHLAHQTFIDSHALNSAIHQAVADLKAERMSLPLAKRTKSPLRARAAPVAAVVGRGFLCPTTLSILREPSPFSLCEAFRIVFGLKSEDGLVVIDGHNDRVSYRPCRVILSRRYFNAEGHLLSGAFGQA